MKKKMLPSLCNLLGNLILLLVIVSCLPLTVPRLFGYEIYEIVSGSMEPEIPVGSVIYVKNVQPEDIEEEDVIAFWSGSSVIAHRVMQNKVVEGEFVTKGDANAAEDLKAVSYSELIGRIEYHFPVVGRLMAVYTSNVGKIYVILFAACGVMLNMLAGCLRDR